MVAFGYATYMKRSLIKHKEFVNLLNQLFKIQLRIYISYLLTFLSDATGCYMLLYNDSSLLFPRGSLPQY